MRASVALVMNDLEENINERRGSELRLETELSQDAINYSSGSNSDSESHSLNHSADDIYHSRHRYNPP